MISLNSPVAIIISDDDYINNQILSNLEYNGFMRKGRLKSIYPYEDVFQDYYNIYRTSPTYFLLTSPYCDETTDGYTLEVLGDAQFNRMLNRYGNIHTYTADEALSRLF